MNCLNCETETKNPKFCSRSCAAIYNNKRHPKRKTQKVCIDCGKPLTSYKYNRCQFHFGIHQSSKVKNLTIGEYRNKQSVLGKHPSWLHSSIRNFARHWNKELKDKPCANCGYSKHVEFCHIKPITSFPNDTLIIEVNSPSNLIQLCPNCHWEFDNELLNLSNN